MEQEISQELDTQDTSPEGSQDSSQDTGLETSPESSETEKLDTAAATEGEETEGEEPAYTPNTKYKVDGKELDFDDKIKGILSKENEPIIRELVEKAHGIDVIKARHEEVKQQRDAFQGQTNQLVGRINEIGGMIKEGDFDSFFEAVGVPFENLANWMARKLKTQEELPQEHKGMYDDNRQYRARLRNSEKQIEEANAAAETAMVQARSIQLDTAIASPTVTDIASEYDARIGEPGGFRRAVIAHAAAQEHATQRSIDAQQAVEGFLRVLGRSPGTAKPAAPNSTGAKKIVTPSTAKTIPNVGAAATAAIGRKPKNLDELKKLAKEFRA